VCEQDQPQKAMLRAAADEASVRKWISLGAYAPRTRIR